MNPKVVICIVVLKDEMHTILCQKTWFQIRARPSGKIKSSDLIRIVKLNGWVNGCFVHMETLSVLLNRL